MTASDSLRDIWSYIEASDEERDSVLGLLELKYEKK